MCALGAFLGVGLPALVAMPAGLPKTRVLRKGARWHACALALLLGCAGPVCAADAPAVDVEYAVKAAYLYKFAGYVDWPATSFPNATTPLTIGVVGADRLVAELARQLAGLSIDSHPVSVAPLKPGDAVNGVQILFIGRDENPAMKRLLAGVQARPVLTVTEVAGALGDGSVINFVTTDNRVRFEISLVAAQRNGLKVSSRLLSVAQQVQTGGP
jgi:hypothetical protein